MNAELKAKWVAALRSGEYQQIKGKLHDGKGYCCMGVLHRLVTGRAPKSYWGLEAYDGSLDLDFDECERPESTRVDGDTTLMHMNDQGKSFAEIADYVEAHL